MSKDLSCIDSFHIEGFKIGPSKSTSQECLVTMEANINRKDVFIRSSEYLLLLEENERLQTLLDNYTQGVSNTQRYKALGNGFTVDVIAHILSYIPKDKL